MSKNSSRRDRFLISDDDIRLTQCILCKHYTEQKRCEAFPNGIPEAIWENKFDHRMPYRGDNGIQFERI